MKRIRIPRQPPKPRPVAEILPQDTESTGLVRSTEFMSFNTKKLSDEQKRFLIGLLMWGTQTRACMETHTSPLSVEEWKKDNKDFLAAYNIVMDAIGDVLEDKAIQMAMAGNEKLLMKLLQGYKPYKYGKKVEIGGPGGGPIPLTFADLARRFADDQSENSDGEGEEESS